MPYTSGSPGSGLLEVGIALVLQDRFSNQAREASSQIKKLHMDAKNAVNANLYAIQNISKAGMVLAAGVGTGIYSAIQEGAQFIDTMVTVKAITQTTTQEFRKLQNTAQTLGLKTMFDSKEIASGMKYLAMAGTEATDIHEVIRGAAMAANATGMELGGKGGAADMITNVMRMFRIEASEAASVVGDQLVKATLSSNMSMQDLAESIRYAGADMVNLRQQLPSVAAMIGTLGNAGIQGSVAGTAISNMARYLNKSISEPGYKGAKILDKLGLSKKDFIDAKGDLIDFGDILEKLRDAMTSQNLTSTEIGGVLLNIFGVRGNRAAATIMRDLEGYRSLLGKIKNESNGFAESVVKQRMDSLAGTIDIFRSAMENLRVTFVTSIEPVVKPVFKLLGGIAAALREVMAIPVLGTFISSTLVATTLTLGIASAVAFLRTKWLLFKNDSQVSSLNWFTILKGGWNAATISAQRYLAVQNAIIGQQKAGIGGNIGHVLLNQGGWVNNVRMSTGKGNKPYFFQRDPLTGGMKRIKPTDAATITGQTTAKQATENVMGSTILNTTTKNIGAKASVGAASGAVTNGLLKGIGKGLTGLMGLFGGPWGLALTAGVMFLPPLVRKISDSISSNKQSKDSTDRLNQTIKSDMLSRLQNSNGKEDQEKALTIEMKELAKVIGRWGELFASGKINQGNFTISLDSKPFVELVDGKIKQANNNSNFDINAQ